MWGNNPKPSSSQQTGNSRVLMTVGQYLKSQREEQGLAFAEVAEMLRINRVYLQAIEDNEIDKLPGPTYAVGFVRAYAEHLGLDGAKVVERFKDEGKVQEKRGQLIFPSPLPEGQIPSGPILLAAAAFFAVAYGGWVFVSSPNDSVVDMIPSLPERIASLVVDDEVKKSEAKKLEAESGAEEKTVASAIALTEKPEPASPSKLEVATSEETATAISNDSAPSWSDTVAEVAKPTKPIAKVVVSTGQETPDQTAAKPETLTLDALEKNVKTKENVPKLGSTPTTETTVGEAEKVVDAIKVDTSYSAAAKSAEEVQTTAAAPTQMASTQVGEREGSGPPSISFPSLDDEPRVFGEMGEESRIKITALVDSWVEVHAGDGKLFLTRVLRKGDRYHVPSQTGLVLVTGNAGGLEFAVDGKVVPKIGPLGTVRRDVKLDPKALMDGTANDP